MEVSDDSESEEEEEKGRGVKLGVGGENNPASLLALSSQTASCDWLVEGLGGAALNGFLVFVWGHASTVSHKDTEEIRECIVLGRVIVSKCSIFIVPLLT